MNPSLVIKAKLLPAVILLSSCLQTASVVSAGQPDWVSGESAEFPNNAYVVANGSASDPETAKDRALSNLSKVFELHIRESSVTKQEVQSHRAAGEEQVAVSESLNRRINTQTDKIIDGARVAAQWQHPDDLTHYALAVLDRRQAGNNIRGEMRKFDEQTDFEMIKVRKISDPLIKVATYQNVISMQRDRDALQKTLKVIDLSGRGSTSQWNQAELRDKLQQSLSALSMRAELLSDSVGGLEKILRGAMANAGFPASSGGGYTLAAGLETQPAFRREGWHWLRGTLTLRLQSPDGNVRGNKTWPLKVSATQPAQLSERMKSAVEKKLNAELKPTILGFATVH